MPISKLKIRKQPSVDLYKVYTVVQGRKPEMRPLSKKGISKAAAERQLTAVHLSELRKMGRIPKRK